MDINQPDLLQIALGLLCGKWQLPSMRELDTGFTDDLAVTFADLIDLYIERVLPGKPRNAKNVLRHLMWWKVRLVCL